MSQKGEGVAADGVVVGIVPPVQQGVVQDVVVQQPVVAGMVVGAPAGGAPLGNVTTPPHGNFSSGLFDCLSVQPVNHCMQCAGLFCPCVLAGQLYERVMPAPGKCKPIIGVYLFLLVWVYIVPFTIPAMGLIAQLLNTIAHIGMAVLICMMSAVRASSGSALSRAASSAACICTDGMSSSSRREVDAAAAFAATRSSSSAITTSITHTSASAIVHRQTCKSMQQCCYAASHVACSDRFPSFSFVHRFSLFIWGC